MTTDHARIAAAQALADDPRAPEGERAAARQAVGRLKARQAARGGYTAEESWHYYDRVYGQRYDDLPRYAPVKDIAQVIREQIKVARKLAKLTPDTGAVAVFDPIGDAPASVKFSVVTRNSSSIDITIKGVPEDWGWTRHECRNHGSEVCATEALVLLGEELASMLAAYNHDGSDSMRDHHDVRFYTSITAIHPTSEYGRPFGRCTHPQHADSVRWLSHRSET